MSGSSSTSEHARIREFITGGICASAGATFALTGVLATSGALIGLGVVVLGIFVSAPAANAGDAISDSGWKSLCIAALVAFAGLALAQVLAAPGGLILGVGCIGTVAAGTWMFSPLLRE